MGLSAIFALVLLLFPGGNRPAAIQLEGRSPLLPFHQAAVLRSQGEFEESFALLQPILTLARRDRRADYQGKCLIRMGILKWDLGDIAESERYFKEAAAAFLGARDRRSQE